MCVLRKVSLCCFAAALVFFFIYGCVSMEGPVTQLKLSKGFVPKKDYSYSFDQTWDKVLQTLRKERIMVASSSKESKTITTDYIEGWTFDIPAIGTDVYRYRYQIGFENIKPSQTRIDIICKIERKHMLKGGSAREAMEQLKPWEDDTYRSKKTAENLEAWLHEQIEKSF
jgi:hypothetical protein